MGARNRFAIRFRFDIMLAAAAAPILVIARPVPAQPLSQPTATAPCRPAIAAVERSTGVPDRLMQAIAIVESGRRDAGGATSAWPWTLNVEGVGEIYESKQEAIGAVLRHRARGARSIDVGCMQVNLMHHADAFTSLDEAFDPAANARYAARFLQQLLAQTGSWPRAVAGYHSLTPDIGAEYARKVLAVWARPELGRPDSPGASQIAQAPRPAPGAVPAALPATAPVRLLASPGSAAPALTGRGLDSYRALPTRLATAAVARRS